LRLAMDAAAPRVAHVVIALACGGLERLVVDWTNERNRRYPHSTEVWCLDAPGELAAQVAGDCVRCVQARRARFPWDVGAVRRLAAGLRGGAAGAPGGAGVAVVHSHNLAAQQYAALALRGSRIGHVHTQHGENPHLRSLLNRWRSRLLARRTSRLVAVSEATARAMARYQGLERERLVVIPNSIAVPTAVAEAGPVRARHGISPRTTVIGSVGRLAWVKGYDRLLVAFRALSAELPDACLLLVGDGPERGALERLAASLGIRSRVIFAGFQPDVGGYYAAMHLFVLPSRSEGVALSLLEAMAAGVPAVATAVGGNRELLADGVAGWILPEDEARWPAVLAGILGNATERERRVAAARERTRTVYNRERTMAAYEALYRAVATACS